MSGGEIDVITVDSWQGAGAGDESAVRSSVSISKDVTFVDSGRGVVRSKISVVGGADVVLLSRGEVR